MACHVGVVEADLVVAEAVDSVVVVEVLEYELFHF